MENHTAVPLEDIIWLHDRMNGHKEHLLTFENSLCLLRRKLFPFSHDPYAFITGKIFRIAYVFKHLGNGTNPCIVFFKVDRRQELKY